MNVNYTKKLVINGLMIALVFLATYFTRVPTPLPGGYFNLGDAVIIVASLVLGRKSGFVAGAVGSMLADVVYGSFLFAPITFVVKGLEGYIAGTIGYLSKDSGPNVQRKILASFVGVSVMVAGYFLAEAFILGFFSEGFGIAAAVSELPINAIQGCAGAILGYLLSAFLISVNVKDFIQ